MFAVSGSEVDLGIRPFGALHKLDHSTVLICRVSQYIGGVPSFYRVNYDAIDLRGFFLK